MTMINSQLSSSGLDIVALNPASQTFLVLAVSSPLPRLSHEQLLARQVPRSILEA